MPQPGFRQVNVPLDATQDFITDDALVPELKDGLPLFPQDFKRQGFEFG
jgi:hypothetical protein